MPRIDPERLLKCLQPLLDPYSGAIRSTDEVDKILGLMSKFSKKLVSKCIYVNILTASQPSVVDLFMERGGWNLVFGWTNDAIAHKNYPLLKQIFNLLMTTPVTVARLKSNRFPIVIKNFSKDCEDEETRNICKQVVSRWITVAKTEEKTDHQPQQVQTLPTAPPPQLITTSSELQSTIPLIDPSASGGGELPNLGNMNTDHLLNIDPSSMNMIPDADGAHQNLMDLDLSHSELAGIDFNLDILNKMVVDGHSLEDAIAGGATGAQVPVQQHQQQGIGGGEINHVVATTTVGAPISVIQHAPAQIQIQQQPQPQIIQHHPQQPQHQIILQQHVQQQPGLHPQIIQSQQQLVQNSANVMLSTPANNITQVVSAVPQQTPQFQFIQQQQTPQIKEDLHPQQQQQLISLVQVQPSPQKIMIKTVGGQRSVVHPDSGSGQFCLMVKDGKNYLVRLKEQPTVVSGANQVLVQQQQMGQSLQVPDGTNGQQVPPPPLVVSQQSQDLPDGAAQNSQKLNKNVKKEVQIISPVNKVPGDMKTYSKTKSSSPSSSSSKDKKSSENSKSASSSEKDRHHKSSSSSSSKSKSDGHHKRSKSSSSSGTSKAAQAAADAKEEERLREKIRREKAQMKKRQKEMDKQKQQTEKDQETLKKLNLIPTGSGSTVSSTGSTASGSSSSKIPKIPKRSNSSFADAIGIPGSDGSSSVDKIKKVSEKSTSKEKSPTPSQPLEDCSSPTKKFYGKKEEEVTAEQEKAKERRHKPKVFVSSKSRSDDLLKEMTESGKAKDKSVKEKEAKDKEEKEAQCAGKSASGISLGNSIPATPPKISKRLSTDSLEKPGDVKKAKLDGKDKEKKQESVRDKIRKQVTATAITLKESSLFMDAISATESTKTVKKKRRTSSGGDSKDAPKPGELTGGAELVDEVSTPTEDKKPVFNFYRETLNDEDSENTSGAEGATENKEENNEQTDTDRMDEDSASGSFTPQENDGKVKSALVLVRSRNRKKKNVRWREEDELREFHYFEMDETERVNVTKQKDFADLSSNEMAIEGSFLKRRGEEEEQDRSKIWRLVKINFTTDILQPTVISTERASQEEREKNVLGLFLPPGSILPDTAIEPDVNAPPGEKSEPKLIPVEDVNTITKVCDYRTHAWPEPKIGPNVGMSGIMMGRGGFGMPSHPPPHHQRTQMDSRDVNHHQFPGQNPHLPSHQQFPPQMVPNPTLSPTSSQDYNPWNSNIGFNVPPTGVPPPTDMGFSQFGAPSVATAAAAMNLMGQGIPPPSGVAFPPNPFAFPPPPPALMNGPPPGAAPPSIMDFGTGNSHRGGNHRSGGTRFDGNNERRNNNFHSGSRDGSGRDRDRSTSRDRDYRDDRGRDRDYRRGGDRDRDYRNHHDRDRSASNNRDFRAPSSGSGKNIRKEIPCRFFKKGFCSNGSRCEFLHEGGPPTHGERDRRRSPSSDQTDNHNSSSHSRHQNSASSSNSNSNDDEDWEKSTPDSPPGTNHIPDSAQSPPQEEQTSVHPPPRTSRFSDAPPTPMSPTDDSPSSPVQSFQTVGESTKVIPV